MNKFNQARCILALIIMACGIAYFLWSLSNDPFKGAAMLACCLLAAEIVRPGAKAMDAHRAALDAQYKAGDAP